MQASKRPAEKQIPYRAGVSAMTFIIRKIEEAKLMSLSNQPKFLFER